MKTKAYAASCWMSLGKVYRVFRAGTPRYCVP
jgi:hypothetical protein